MGSHSRRSVKLRSLRASLRDTWLLLREFSWPLGIFIIAVLGGGILYYKFASIANEPLDNLLASIYQMLGVTFLQPMGDFPHAWYLGIFYFIMPIIGLVALSHGVAEFGIMFFNRKQRSKEWEMAVASTFRKHHILIGLGHLGFRVASNLHALSQDVVVIEHNPKVELVANVKKMDIPVIQEDATRQESLEAAGVKYARTIILCTQNDGINLQVALKARRLNPTIHVVIRIFDTEFSQALHDQFGFTAFSATQMAAPMFAAAATGVDMTQPISIAGQTLSLATFTISDASNLVGLQLSQIEEQYNVSVVFLSRNNEDDMHPSYERQLEKGDIMAVLGGPVEIIRLGQVNS